MFKGTKFNLINNHLFAIKRRYQYRHIVCICIHMSTNCASLIDLIADLFLVFMNIIWRIFFKWPLKSGFKLSVSLRLKIYIWMMRWEEEDVDALLEWAVSSLIQIRISKLKTSMSTKATPIFKDKDVTETLSFMKSINICLRSQMISFSSTKNHSID